MTSRRVPSFFVIGFPKCGTTSFHNYLSTHPTISMSRPKEPHYFSPDYPFGPSFGSFSDYMETCFGNAAPSTVLGESSVFYCLSKVALPRIANINPAAKFVLLLRNPIDAAHSLYSQHVAFGWESSRDFVSTLNRTADARRPSSFSDRNWRISRYAEVYRVGTNLSRIQATVGASRLLVLWLDDLRSDPRGAYLQALDFLGVQDDGRKVFEVANAARRWPPALARLALSRPALKIARAAREVAGVRGFGLGRPTIRLDAETYDRALPYFRSEIEDLASVTGRNLSSWLMPSGEGALAS